MVKWSGIPGFASRMERRMENEKRNCLAFISVNRLAARAGVSFFMTHHTVDSVERRLSGVQG